MAIIQYIHLQLLCCMTKPAAKGPIGGLCLSVMNSNSVGKSREPQGDQEPGKTASASTVKEKITEFVTHVHMPYGLVSQVVPSDRSEQILPFSSLFDGQRRSPQRKLDPLLCQAK